MTALNIDPYNFKAREYLSRLEARQKVTRGEVTEDMGHSLETAIGITDIAQQYEYLRLFDVEPLVHQEMAAHPVDMWQCIDRNGAPVAYYFNRSQAHQWAFAPAAASAASVSDPVVQSASLGPPVPTPGIGGSSASGSKTALSKVQKPGKIWESKIFK